MLPAPTAAALDAYLTDRAATSTGPTVGPLLATANGGRLDQARCGSSCAAWPAPPAFPPGRSCPHTRFVTPPSPLALDAGAALRDMQDYAGHRDSRTTRRYDRARDTLDRNAAYALTAYFA
jgi:hypothetical protein